MNEAGNHKRKTEQGSENSRATVGLVINHTSQRKVAELSEQFSIQKKNIILE